MPRRLGLLAVLLAFAGCGAERADEASLNAPLPRHPPARAAAAKRVSGAVPRGWRLVVALRRRTALRARPGGRVLAQLDPTTAFGSPTVLPVLRKRGRWYAVLSPALPNGRAGWVSARAPLRQLVTDYRVDVSLRRRQVVVRRARRVVARFPVAVGAPATPTPTGRFAITDKLLTHDPSSPYGCCILALSAHQPHTPQGWGGGDRIAIHTTNAPGTIGSAASFGCLRAPQYVMRRLVRIVPLGTVVTIRA